MQPHNPMAHILPLILFFSSIISTNIHACNQIERSSLLSFTLSLSSPPLNWTSVNCCHWKGITCNQDGWVTHLLLPSKGLKGGMFPSSLGNLTHLTHLNLSNNSLYGSLQTEFLSALKHLEILDLSYNLLSGELPLHLPCSSIKKLDLSSNQFHGAIPSSSFQQARNLTSFNVSNNIFSGSIPSSICLQHSSPLTRLLDFSSNKFNGSISRGLGECSALRVFRASHNNLSGFLPEDIYNATKLEELTLALNSLYGTISDRIVNLTNLAILDLYYNQLSGVLPLNFGKLPMLKLLNLDFNHLEGALPPSLMNCTNLIEIHLASNNLEGEISTLNFSKLSELSKIDLMGNEFTGILPISMYLCRSLKAIRLTENYIEGQIQAEILSLKSLSFLSLSFNRLKNVTGAMKILMSCKSLHVLLLTNSFEGEVMPADDDMAGFDGFQNLRFLSLANCQLTGRIPVWLSNLKNLQILHLEYNQITGPIPSWLGTLPRLFSLNLASNRISGEFPKQLCGLPRLIYEPFEEDTYELELPLLGRKITNPTFLPHRLSFNPAMIDLSRNNIDGDIPNEISQLHLLRLLRLCSNNFSGIIPDQISNLKNLEELNLSMNHLSGKIPSSLTTLNFLKKFDVSYNNLEGPIPTSTQIQSFDASAFEGNPKLCGAPSPNKCKPNNGTDADGKNNKHEGDGHQHQLPWFYISSLVLGFMVGFWGVCGSLIIKKRWRYAYFGFIDNIQDRLYVIITVSMNRMKRWLRG